MKYIEEQDMQFFYINFSGLVKTLAVSYGCPVVKDKENQIFYNTYFKLCYDDKHLISIYDAKRAEKEHMDSNLKYHIEFFRNGLNAIIKLWLAGGCQESPEEMAEVLKSEYRGR